VPRAILADSVRLRQVLVNLIGNAIKFTEDGEIELRVDVIRDLEGVHEVEGMKLKTKEFRFSVRDSGIGIHPDNQKKIFEAFTQADTYTTKQFGGTGLGLTITNRLLDLMGSHLDLHSELGKGSIFFFDIVFPVVERQKTESTQPISTTPLNGEKVAEHVNGQRVKVLIAEDNPVNMALAKILIKKILPHVLLVEASNGKLAVEQFKIEKPDIIFMDVQMPLLNGYEATAEIRHLERLGSDLPGALAATHSVSSPPRVPIVALTAGTVKGEKERCLESGMDDYLSKPIVNEALRSAIKKWLGERTVLASAF
jgi:CheY-like chemotaxis protein